MIEVEGEAGRVGEGDVGAVGVVGEVVEVAMFGCLEGRLGILW